MLERFANAFHLHQIDGQAVLDIAVLAVIIYQILLLIRGTRAVHMIAGVVALGVVHFLTRPGLFHLPTVHSVLGGLLLYIPFAVIVLFQNQIRQAPDVILMDLMMPEMDGIAATRAILQEFPEIKIIALTSFDEEELVQGVLAAGAISYLLKNVTSDELVKAIREAVSGRSTLSPEAARVLVQATRPAQLPIGELTERERQVLNLVVQGQSNQQIADAMIISLATVKAHISSILSKLQVSSRAEAIAYAIKHKIVSL